MRLLRVLDLPLVAARLRRDVVGAEQGRHLLARGGERRLRQRRRVGAHVRDVAVLVQALREPHRRLRGEAELAARLLLQRRGHERRARAADIRLPLDAGDLERRALEPVGEPARRLLVELARLAAQLPVGPEVAAGRHALPVEGDEPRLEAFRIEGRDQVPPRGGAERHPLALALDDEARRDRLDAAGRESAHDLLPEHRRDLVAVEPVEDPPRLLRVDEPFVDVARLVERPVDRVARDLVEDHPPHGHLRLQHLEQVPGDRLALAILVRREQELVGVGELLAQLSDRLLLVGVDDVERLEPVLDVDAEARPRLALVLLGDLRGAVGQVANVADGGLDDEVGPEVAGDRPCLRRRLDDDQSLRHRRVTIATGRAGKGGPGSFGRAPPALPAALPAPRRNVILRGMRPPLLYNVVAVLSWPILHGLFRLRVQGRENVPTSGGYVLACNHLSNFDPWPLGMPLWPNRWLRFMAKAELYWWPATYVLDAVGAFPVHRERADVEAVQTAVRLAREGNVVVMFPEGTRRKKGLVKKHQARARVRRGADRAGRPACRSCRLPSPAPTGCSRSGRCASRTARRSRWTDLRATGDLRGASQEATDRLMARIAELEASL